MAINFTNLFTLLGKTIKAVNNRLAYYSELDTDEAAIESVYSAQSRYDLLADVPNTWLNFKNSVLSWIATLNAKTVQTLTDPVLVLANLPLGSSNSINQVLPYLIADMVTQSKSVAANTVTIGSVSTSSTNPSVGSLLTSKVLDGYSSPGSNLMACPTYNGLDSELSVDDSVTIVCTQDSEASGIAEGFEVFQWLGLPPAANQFGWNATGSGTGPSIKPLNAESYFTNLEFENFSTNTPTAWTLDSGSAGTQILKEATTVQRGTYALELLGDGSLATIQISQAPTVALVPLRRYCFAVWVQGTTATASGALTIQFEGTGYSASSSEKISMDATALSAATSWTLKHFFINMPREIPDDMKLVIKVTGTLTAAKSVFLDGACFGPVTFYNGINVAIVCGNDKFLVGDKFTFTTSNDDNGVIQTHFRKQFGVQLISSGSPNIADSLAT